jgi:hypothetical protein
MNPSSIGNVVGADSYSFDQYLPESIEKVAKSAIARNRVATHFRSQG